MNPWEDGPIAHSKRPRSGVPQAGPTVGVRMDVRIPTAGRRKIDGTLILPHSKRSLHPAALFLHGWGSDRRRHLLAAERLAEIGFVSLAIDLRGHGKTLSL